MLLPRARRAVPPTAAGAAPTRAHARDLGDPVRRDVVDGVRGAGPPTPVRARHLRAPRDRRRHPPRSGVRGDRRPGAHQEDRCCCSPRPHAFLTATPAVVRATLRTVSLTGHGQAESMWAYPAALTRCA